MHYLEGGDEGRHVGVDLMERCAFVRTEREEDVLQTEQWYQYQSSPHSLPEGKRGGGSCLCFVLV